jgi:hypothetical protein
MLAPMHLREAVMSRAWNERLGWILLLAGWTWAVGLDPWSLSEHDPEALVGSARMTARHAQAVVLGMGFLQLALALLLASPELSELGRRLASLLTAAGAVVYAAGYVSLATRLPLPWLIPLGAFISLLGFASLGGAVFRPDTGAARRVVVVVFCLGMLIDLAAGLFAAFPSLVPALLESEVGVRQRMLRLARVAAVALSLLVLLFRERAERAGAEPWARRGEWGLLVGCAGMPTILMAAAFVSIHLKYLLPIPALGATFGVLVALWLARRQARPLEQWGWLLIAVSLNVGLLIGLYAFDGPLPAPPTQEMYNGFDRRLVRLAHAYCIMLGLLCVLAARAGTSPLGARQLITASCVALVGIALEAIWPAAPWLLAGGPVAVVLAVALAWASARRDVAASSVP